MKRLAALSALMYVLSTGSSIAMAQQERHATSAVAAPATLTSESAGDSPGAATSASQEAPGSSSAAMPSAMADNAATPVNPVEGSAATDEQGVKIKGKKQKKEKKVKLTSVSITAGTLTVDGWTGKAQLNYDIANLQYLYFYAPGVGTAIVSNVKFPGSTEQKNAFSQGALTLMVDGHMVQLQSSTHLIRGKKDESAWVKLDSTYSADTRFPIMGYGSTPNAPYVWPGAKPQDRRTLTSVVAPPLPTQLRPKLLTAACVPAPGQACAASAGRPTIAFAISKAVPASTAAAIENGEQTSESAAATPPVANGSVDTTAASTR